MTPGQGPAVAEVVVVVVEADLGAVVVVLGAVVVVVDAAVVLVVVELVAPVVELVVVDGAAGVVVVGVPGDDGVKTVARFASSSIAVTTPNASRKTMAALAAKAFHVNRRPVASLSVSAAVATPAAPVTRTTPAPSNTAVGSKGAVVASKSSDPADGTPAPAGTDLPSSTPRTCKRSVAATSRGTGGCAISVLS